jgi:hypothetical protein
VLRPAAFGPVQRLISAAHQRFCVGAAARKAYADACGDLQRRRIDDEMRLHCRSILLATASAAPAESASSMITTNSSPPRRAARSDSRRLRCRRRAKLDQDGIAAAWPSVSLIFLK